MLKRVLKILSVCLLLSIPVSVPVFQGFGQQPNRNEPSEIIFSAKNRRNGPRRESLRFPG